jgi:hypothetical protein
MLLELDLEQKELVEQALVAVDLVLALGAGAEHYLVAAVVVEVVADLHYPVADSHHAVVLGSADLEMDSAVLGPHSHCYHHLLLGYPLD